MQGLFIKDIISLKKAFTPIALISGTLGLAGILIPFFKQDDSQNIIFFPVMFMAALFAGGGYSLSYASLNRDDSKRWAYYISSSPVGTDGQVASKYLFIIAMIFCFSLVSLIFDGLMCVLHKEYISLATLIYIFSAVQILFRAIDIPFILRWGSAKGDIVKMCFLLAVIAAVVLYLLFGDLTIFSSADSLAESLIKQLEEPSVFLGKVLGTMGLVSMAAFYISYRISLKLYPKGVECIGE